VTTPIGRFPITLYSTHDLLTVNEVFCRRDYGDGDGRVFVDVGANIGITALYFLTRDARNRVHCYEPVPRNVERLRVTLAGLEDRYQIEPVAVTVATGAVRFWTEPTGRYGEIYDDGDLEVQGEAIGDVLERVVAREGTVDVVKIDIEGREQELVDAIPDDLPISAVVWEESGHVRWRRSDGSKID
jgi:FkbM family methyltransferase